MAHAGRCAAAAEVCNLIEFVHRSARFRQNRAAAGDKAPCIEIAALLDCNGAVIRHFDVSIITNGTSLLAAASGKIPAAQTDGAIDGNGRAFAHRQRPERLRRGSVPNRRRSIRIQCPCRVERNQKCYSSRNGIAAADGAIRSQRNLGLAVFLRIGDRFVQVVKRLSSGFKQGRRFTCEPRCDGAVAVNVQRSLCICVDVFTIGNIVPAHELIARRRSRHYLISGHGALRVAIFLGNKFSVYCISAVFSRHESRSCIDIAYQNHVGKGDLSGSIGAAGLDVDLDAGVGCQFLGELAARRDRSPVHLNGAAVLLDGISKGQCSLCSLVVFDGQRRIVGCVRVARPPRRRLGRTDDLRAAGAPRIICVARKTQADVLVSQTGHGAAGRRPRRGSHGGQQCQHHQHGQRQRQETFENLLHLLCFPPLFWIFSRCV